MNKLLILLTAIGVGFFSSCENKPQRNPEPSKMHDTSLAGTRWEGRTLVDFEDYNDMYELVFTEDTVDHTYYHTADFVSKTEVWNFTGTYTYHPPVVTITEPDGTEHKGTVDETTGDGDTLMHIRIRGVSFHLVLDAVAKP